PPDPNGGFKCCAPWLTAAMPKSACHASASLSKSAAEVTCALDLVARVLVEEARERSQHFLGLLLANEMASGHRMALDTLRPLAPLLQRLRLGEAELVAPDRKQRRGSQLVAAIRLI